MVEAKSCFSLLTLLQGTLPTALCQGYFDLAVFDADYKVRSYLEL